jgi:hypothetical protein
MDADVVDRRDRRGDLQVLLEAQLPGWRAPAGCGGRGDNERQRNQRAPVRTPV